MSMVQRLVLATLFSVVVRSSQGQAHVTASRVGDLQVGATFSLANPDYAQDMYSAAQPTAGQDRWHGYGVYADLDLRYHFGVEIDFHQLSGPDPVLYERTYEVGARYLHPLGRRFVPYAKVLVGRGVFNFAAVDANGTSLQIANLAYNLGTAGAGLDVKVLPGVNVRLLDYEYQHWLGFPPNRLNPQVLSVGVAYHFH